MEKLPIDNLRRKEQSGRVALAQEIYRTELSEQELGLGIEVPFFVPGMTVYNPTLPFENNGEMVIAGRVEQREGHDSTTVFFHERGGIWFPIADTPVFKLEDPFVTKIGENIVFGGVEVDHVAHTYRTVLKMGADIQHLEPLAVGPAGMKDIRLVDMRDGRIGVFSRPQGSDERFGGRGKIGFCTISALGEIDESTILDAPLIHDWFGRERWGGVNQAILLADGITIGIVGHVAEFESDGGKRYSTMVFEYNMVTGESSSMGIIARREDFPLSEPKIEGLKNVVFTSGITFGDGQDVVLWCGIGDASVGQMKVEWPFSMKAL